MNYLTQFLLKKFRPAFYAFLTKIFYFDKRIVFGKKFRTDSIPRIIIDGKSKLVIGNNVEFRRNIEIRIHKGARIYIGENVRIDRGVRLLSSNGSQIQVGGGVRIGLYSVLNGGADIYIGEKTLISGFVYLQTSMHGFKSREMSVQDQGYEHGSIRLERDVWLGTHVVIMPGISIHEGGVVGSNAVVTKDIEKYDVVAGIPAKSLKSRQ